MTSHCLSQWWLFYWRIYASRGLIELRFTSNSTRCKNSSQLEDERWIHIMMASSDGKIFRVTGLFCEEFTGHRWIPRKRPVRRNFDIFFDLRLNNRLSKQWRGWGFETPSCPLWRHRIVINGQVIRKALPYPDGIMCYEWHLRSPSLRITSEYISSISIKLATRD